MEPYVPLSRIPGAIIVARLDGRSLAPIRYFPEEQESVKVLGSPEKPADSFKVTTLRDLVGAAKAPSIREVFCQAA